MKDQVFNFGGVRVEVTPESVVCSTGLPAWINRFFSQLDAGQLRGFIEDGRLVNRIEVHQLDGATVEVRGRGIGYLEVLLSNRSTPRGLGRLLYMALRSLPVTFLPMSSGIVRLRGDAEIERAKEAATVMNTLAAAYHSRFRKHVLDLFHLYEADVRYTWQIIPSASSGTVRTMSYIFYLCALMPGAAYAVLFLLELISTGLAFWASVILAVLTLSTLFNQGMMGTGFSDAMAQTQLEVYDPHAQADPNARRLVKINAHLSTIAMFTAAGIASFAVIGFMMGSPHYWFADGFHPSPMPRLAWSLFMAETFLDTLTLDVFGALGIELSTVSTTTRGASASVVFLKIFMASGIVAAIYRAVKTGQKTHSFVGTPRELVTEVFTNTNFLSIGEVVLDGKVTSFARSYVFDTKTPANLEDAWEAP
ncbi:MAG TPA: hypothetical protein VHG93_03670 [Longimicrobium sp.]|nr:hypothetical protein [Longimicrobium sp.]